MKHLKKFENFYLSPDVEPDDQEWQDHLRNLKNRDTKLDSMPIDEMPEDDEIDSFFIDNEEDTDRMSMSRNNMPMYEMPEEEEEKHIMSFGDLLGEAKKNSYKKSGLKNPKKADLNKDKKISGYEKKRGKAIEDSIAKKGGKGLTAEQKEKLSPALQKAILAKKK